MQFSSMVRLGLAGAAAVLLFGAAPPTGADPAALAGVWDALRSAADDTGSSITVAPGHATFRGVVAAPAVEGRMRVYRFPGSRGALRVTTVGGEQVAFWTQPPTARGTAYATPVALRLIARNTYRGVVEPLPDRLSMSLYIQHEAAGKTSAFLRDPLFNIGRRLQTMTVVQTGTTLSFTGPGQPLTATLDAPNALTMTLPDSGVPPLTFTRRTQGEPPVNAAYHQPSSVADGWNVASARDVRIDTRALEELTRFAAGVAPTSVTSPAVHAVLIARRGKLVYDRYFAGFDEATLHDTRSAGKTYADVLAGAAIAAGVALRDDTPLLPLFARYGVLAHPDPRKARITLGNALSMSTGLDCDDNDDNSIANEDRMQNQTAQPDWYRLVLDGRVVRDPGTKAVYCSASINLAGGAIASAAHVWLPALFAHDVAEPLQMTHYALNLAPTGEWYLGGGAYVRPRDFLKIGQLFLNGGTWNGRRILTREWIERSWDPRVALDSGDGYGYAWHVRSYTVAGAAYRAYEAQGNGGQILDVLPQLDLAVMMTQGNYNNSATWAPTRDAIVTRIIEASHIR